MSKFIDESITNCRDIGYVIKMMQEYDHFVDFLVYEIYGTAENGKVLLKRTANGCDDFTENMGEADVFLEGSIKWDGCSDWTFPGLEKCMLHFCGRNDATDLGALMAKLYDLAKESIPCFPKD